MRASAAVLLALSFVWVTAAARAFVAARQELSRAQVAQHQGELERALVHYRRASRWDAPLNGYARQARTSLLQLGAHFEARGDRKMALMAYRALHASILATRGLWVRHPEQLAEADERIAALMAAEPTSEPAPARSEVVRRAAYLSDLSATGSLSVPGVLLALGGLLTWLGALSAALLWGLDREGRLVRKVAYVALLCAACGFVAFLAGLRIA